MAKAQQSRPKRLAAAVRAKIERAKVRRTKGRLRDCLVGKTSVERYKKHVKCFLDWLEGEGLDVPTSTDEFDPLLSRWAEVLWQEGDSKSVLAYCLSGWAHFVPSLKLRMAGTWRMYHGWSKMEKPKQAPPLDLVMLQGIAGWMAQHGFRRAALLTLTAFHCILRISELLELRTGDVSTQSRGLLLTLRDTKIGSRVGVHQEVSVVDQWLTARLQELVQHTPSGKTLVDCTGPAYRSIWRRAVDACRIPRRFTPYSLRRGGATATFRRSGSFDFVAERGRWTTTRALRIYINAALLESAEGDATPWHSRCKEFTKALTTHL